MMEVIITGLTTILATYIGVRVIRPAIESKITEDILLNNLKGKQKQDAEIRRYCREVIRSIEDSGELDRGHTIATDELIENILKVSKNYAYLSVGASEGVATYCFLFERICSDLQDKSRWPTKITKENIEKDLPYSYLLNFIYFFSVELLQLSSTYFSHPQKLKIQNTLPVKPRYKSFFSKSTLAQIPGLSNDIDLSQDSYYLSSFYEKFLLNHSLRNEPVFSRLLFRTVKNNDFLLKFLFLSKIYIPMKLTAHRYDELLGNDASLHLHLIHFKTEKTVLDDGSIEKHIKAIYSNIKSRLSHQITDKKIRCMSINDPFFPNTFLEDKLPPNKIKCEDQDYIVSISFDKGLAQKLFEEKKGKIEDILILDTNRNYLAEKCKIKMITFASKHPRIASSLNLPRDK